VAEAFFLPNYIQHSAHIPPGREGLLDLVESLPPTHQREIGAMVAEGDLVMAHGRLWGYGDGRPNRVVEDVVRIADGLLAEHWDVIEDEASRRASRSGLRSFWRQLFRGPAPPHAVLTPNAATAPGREREPTTPTTLPRVRASFHADATADLRSDAWRITEWERKAIGP
jgi:predicted SnoaL-like aldol condensation-catalyzing enzyme